MHRPGHAGNAAHFVEVIFLDRLEFVDVLTAGSMTQISASAMSWIWLVRPQHQAAKNRRLLRDQQSRESDPGDAAEYLARSPISIFRAIRYIIPKIRKHERRTVAYAFGSLHSYQNTDAGSNVITRRQLISARL